MAKRLRAVEWRTSEGEVSVVLRSPHQESSHPRLKRQRITHFGIELLGVLIDGRHFLRQVILPSPLLDKIPQDSFNK